MPSLNTFQRCCLSVAISQALLAPITAHAGTFTIDTISDADSAAGCSLREAVETINTGTASNNGCAVSINPLGTDDEINFALPTGSTITLSGSELAITTSVSINGPGATELTINANNASRIFNFDNAPNSVVDGLTLSGGTTFSQRSLPQLGDLGLDNGGAIFVTESPSLAISNTVITDNVSRNYGGGIAINESSFVTISNSTISDNSTSLASGGLSIRNSSDSVNISDSIISDNYAANGAGGMFVYGSDSVTISNSTISGNTAGREGLSGNAGGGILILTSDSVTISNSTISNNVRNSGIQITYSDFATILDSTITGNSSQVSGGGVGFNESDSASISRSTISNNSASFSGGGVYFSSEEVVISVVDGTTDGSVSASISDSMISGNSAGFNGGGVSFRNSVISIIASTIANNRTRDGGGLSVSGATSGNLVNTTISGNTAGSNNILSVSGRGGGIMATSTSNVNLFATTITGNRALGTEPFRGGGIFAGFPANIVLSVNNVVANSLGGDCNISVASGDFNWIEDNSCLATPVLALSGDPGLGQLRDNGGPTLTHAPLAGSGLIDAGETVACAGDIINGVDQRGEARGTSTCFIGSVEGVSEEEPIEQDEGGFFVVPLSNGKSVIFEL